MVADVDVRLVGTKLLYSVEGKVVDAGGFNHVQEHVAGNQLLELKVVVDLGQKDLQKPLGMEGFPLVHDPAVSGDDVGEVVQKLRILLQTRDCVLEILTLVRADISEIVLSHMILSHTAPPMMIIADTPCN